MMFSPDYVALHIIELKRIIFHDFKNIEFCFIPLGVENLGFPLISLDWSIEFMDLFSLVSCFINTRFVGLVVSTSQCGYKMLIFTISGPRANIDTSQSELVLHVAWKNCMLLTSDNCTSHRKSRKCRLIFVKVCQGILH